VDLTTWQHVVGTFDGSNLRLYKNGSLISGPNSASPASAAGPVADIGSFFGAFCWNGNIDEVHISTVARSAAWITAEYNNQNSPVTFITLGTESLPSTTPTPAAPSNLVATAISRNEIDLTWSDNSTNETGFSIERCKGGQCSNFRPLINVGPNTTSFQDTGLTKNTTYKYRVRAFNDSGYS